MVRAQQMLAEGITEQIESWRKSLGTIVGRIMAPKGVHILIPVTCSFVWYMAKWN